MHRLFWHSIKYFGSRLSLLLSVCCGCIFFFFFLDFCRIIMKVIARGESSSQFFFLFTCSSNHKSRFARLLVSVENGEVSYAAIGAMNFGFLCVAFVYTFYTQSLVLCLDGFQTIRRFWCTRRMVELILVFVSLG